MSGVPSLPAEIDRSEVVAPTTSGIDASLEDTPIENYRPYRVIVIGAGFSGINCAIRIPERLRNIDLTVYEKNSEIGGTWFENRYPGCACDVPAHSYQYSYAPNHSWSGFYAPSEEICAYLHGVAERFSATRYIKCGHKVLSCEWDESTGKWNVTIEVVATGRVFVDQADSIICARGSLNDIQWPEIDGLNLFNGKIMHSATWDSQYDFSGKKVGVIGAGSSAIQIVPKLQKVPGIELSCFVRSKTWISSPFGAAVMEELGLDDLTFSDKQKAGFRGDPEKYHAFRKAIEQDGNSVHFLTILKSELQKGARQALEADMRDKLSSRPDIAESILPDFAVACRRLTPGIGYLEALQEKNVTFINTKIKKITPTGILLFDGREVDLDVIVCATGFKAAKAPPFPILGRNSVDMAARFEPYPETYLSMTMSGFPNFFSILGPNSLIGTGSLTMMLESEADYIIKCIRKLQRENIRSMDVKEERVKDFSRYIDDYFKQTVYLDGCRSWYRSEGGSGQRVTGLWPGSALHAIEAFRSPRWEDFEYAYQKDKSGKEVSQFKWLGNGWSYPQRHGGDLAFYLEPEYLDTPSAPLPENTRMYQIRSFCY